MRPHRSSTLTDSRTARLWWWGLAAALAMGLKLAAAFWAIHQGSRALGR